MGFNFFQRGAQADVPEQKASATGPVVAYQTGSRPFASAPKCGG